MVGLAFGTLLMLGLASVLAVGEPGWAVKEAVRMVIGFAFERSGTSTGVAAGLSVVTHGWGRYRRTGHQVVTTTFPWVWPAPT